MLLLLLLLLLLLFLGGSSQNSRALHATWPKFGVIYQESWAAADALEEAGTIPNATLHQ